MPKYAVMIEVEEGDWIYVSSENPFDYNSEPLLFETRDEALAEAKNWNTGVVVERMEKTNA